MHPVRPSRVRAGPGEGIFGGVSETKRNDNLGEKLPIRMLHDRVLVRTEGGEGERRSTGGILIPATAELSKRCSWAEAVAVGQNVRSIEPGDRVLFDPEDRAEVEVRGTLYVLLRERDIHAVASERVGDAGGSTGLYL
ncbi:co-chaperone GroES [Peterkaempfera bronchialis]|uniref:10 kDa chaperonin n=2 Tax=Peterkaempfera bronchialis TaxID=2126346 RepID=A0A345T5Q9_9ACTN|nr:co-chaperone GroES [Peterkaempfera bronchialis]